MTGKQQQYARSTKKDDKSDPGNYRPVSLTSVPCRVMESIIKDEVTAFLDKNGFYNNCQHGFVKGRSMLTNLLETLESWTRLIEHGFGIDVIYLDYRKAFDTVPHQRLLEKIKRLGLGSDLLAWIGNFLHNIKMRVYVRVAVPSGLRLSAVFPRGLYWGCFCF